MSIKFTDSLTGTIYKVPEWIVKNFEKVNKIESLPRRMEMVGETERAYRFKFEDDLVMFPPKSRTTIDEGNDSVEGYIQA